MRLIISAVVALAVGGVSGIGANAADLKQVDLLIVAGQSNAVGADTDPGEMLTNEADQHIMFWWKCGDPPPDEHDSTSGGKWSHLQAQPLGNPKKPRQGRQYGNFVLTAINAASFGAFSSFRMDISMASRFRA